MFNKIIKLIPMAYMYIFLLRISCSNLFEVQFSGNKRILMAPHMLFEKKTNRGP